MFIELDLIDSEGKIIININFISNIKPSVCKQYSCIYIDTLNKTFYANIKYSELIKLLKLNRVDVIKGYVNA